MTGSVSSPILPPLDRLLLPPLLACAAMLWVAGVTLPILEVTKLFLWEDEIVIWRATFQVFREGSAILGAILLLFTLVLPVMKLASTGHALAALARARTAQATRGLAWIERFGKWSMLDVFVIAVAVFAAKSGWQAEATVRPGLYCFAGFALLSSGLALRVKQLAHRAAALETP